MGLDDIRKCGVGGKKPREELTDKTIAVVECASNE